jgi:hypothetical protein
MSMLTPIMQAAMGAFQMKQANKINPERPTYEIPQEILANKAMYESQANSSRLPGQSTLENNVSAQNANTIERVLQASSSSGDILNAISGVGHNSNMQMNDIAIQGANMQMLNRDKLAGANNTLAEYRDQEFDYNKNQPYELDLMRKRALEGAAWGNMSGSAASMDSHIESQKDGALTLATKGAMPTGNIWSKK